ncbi:MAG: O-antigen ligase family protein [Verrucomicrobiia bacterium]
MLARDLDALQQGSERMLQVTLLASVVALFSRNYKTPAPGFVALTILGFVLVGYSFATGDFQQASEVGQRGSRVLGYRAESLTSNSNSLGVAAVWATAGLLYLWPLLRRDWERLVLTLCLVPLLAGIAFSGSRKAFIGVFLIVFGWAWICHRRSLLRNWRALISAAVLAGICAIFAFVVMKHTFLGHRMEAGFTAAEAEGSRDGRLALYCFGLEAISESPFFGLGLDQFRSRYGAYAHSEYIEITANGGLLGAGLYFSVFAFTVRRLVRVRRTTLHRQVWYSAGVCIAVICTYAVLSIALVSYSSLVFWVLMASIVGYARGADELLADAPACQSARGEPHSLVRHRWTRPAMPLRPSSKAWQLPFVLGRGEFSGRVQSGRLRSGSVPLSTSR